jgi:hypothetical protein
MKTGMSKGISFGFSSVHAGQRNVSVEPQLIATSTDGGFRLTAPVTAALGIASGNYVQFVSNVTEIDNAIREKQADVVAFCEENGLDITSPEAYAAIHKEFDMWGIAKGFKEYDPKGNVRMTTERLTMADKVRFAKANYKEMYAAAMESGNEEIIAALTRDGITEEEQYEVLAAGVQPREVEKYRGSRAANIGGITTPGVPVTFSDTAIWNRLKGDLKEKINAVNRIFELNLDEVHTIELNNGFESVPTKVLILGEYTDKEPARRGEAEEAE